MIIILGGRGRLGRALAREFRNERVLAPERSAYKQWWREDSRGDIARYLESGGTGQGSILIACGLIDPRLEFEQLRAVNYRLPVNIIEAVRHLDFKVFTFGTILEHFSTTNNYAKSKKLLADHVEEYGGWNVLHMRLHTLYGAGEPPAFMFLGQIVQALRAGTEFSMTSGRQLREYHHFRDEAKGIRAMMGSGVRGTIDLSHGHPVTLRDIAKGAFAALGKEHLLHVGAIPDPPEENFHQAFDRPSQLNSIHFRPSLPAINEYVKGLVPFIETV